MLNLAPVLALNHVLARASWAKQRLLAFAGRRVHIALAPVALTLEIDPQGYFQAAADQHAEVHITWPNASVLQALHGIDSLIKSAHISGPADMADTLGFVLRNLHWDAEEDLSRLIGDIAAHRVFGVARLFRQRQQQAHHNIAANVQEYLQHESGTLPRHADVHEWKNDIAQLQQRLQQLEQRCRHLG